MVEPIDMDAALKYLSDAFTTKKACIQACTKEIPGINCKEVCSGIEEQIITTGKNEPVKSLLEMPQTKGGEDILNASFQPMEKPKTPLKKKDDIQNKMMKDYKTIFEALTKTKDPTSAAKKEFQTGIVDLDASIPSKKSNKSDKWKSVSQNSTLKEELFMNNTVKEIAPVFSTAKKATPFQNPTVNPFNIGDEVGSGGKSHENFLDNSNLSGSNVGDSTIFQNSGNNYTGGNGIYKMDVFGCDLKSDYIDIVRKIPNTNSCIRNHVNFQW